MKKIDICYVIVNCKITGPMNQTLNIIKNLDKNKFNVSLITLFEEETNNSMIDEYLKICSQHVCLGLNRITSLLYGSICLHKALKKVKPHIIHALGMPPYRLSLSYKDACHLVTLRNYAYEDYPSYYNKVIGPVLAFLDINLIKQLSKKGETFVTCSKSLSDIYMKKENLKLDFIRNGVDIERFSLRKESDVLNLRKKLGLPISKILLIYTAPFNQRKNQEELIEAFLNLNNNRIALILCGDGDNYSALKTKYRNDSIIFTGKVKNISEYLRASDIYVSSSKSEGLPNSVLEAMASGLPVILSNINQHMELIELDDIGYSYKLGDTHDLSDKINIMLDTNYRKYGENSFKCIKNNLTSKKMSNNYQQLYQHLYSKAVKK